MKRYICALCALLLAGCSSQPSPAPSPTPEVTASPAATPRPDAPPQPTSAPETSAEMPAPEDVPGDPALLGSFLERLFSSETWDTWYMIVPASGPCHVTMYADESAEAMRAIFSDVRWEAETWADHQARSEALGGIEISRNVYLRSNESNEGLILLYGTETAMLWYDDGTVYFHAPDVDAYIAAIFDLSPIPELRYAETVIPWQDDHDAAARSYAEAFRQRYLDSGFVTGLRLERVTAKDYGGDTSQYLCVVLDYALKPAQPELAIWQKYMDWYDVDSDGWLHIRHEVHLDRMADDLLRFNFSQQPMEEE